ncbi:hypothetical protein [Ectothiorhodospira shaposhnikovii]|uniref:hypothetical protein n=1 Tax=Ectothiorhodospira shaposhnikovii TaxID=1054 RepID=UPI001902CE4F|nr:hypothetical protein [Ectothiorhodospira shaposhnikovii]
MTEYLVELKVNGVTAEDYYPVLEDLHSDLLLLPAVAIWQAGEGRVFWEHPDQLYLGIENTGESLRVRMGKKEVEIGGIRRPQHPFEVMLLDGDVLISRALLQEAFDVEMEFDPLVQQLTIRSGRPWPRDLRLAREMRWRRLGQGLEEGRSSYVVNYPYGLWSSPQVDISLSGRTPTGKGPLSSHRALVVGEALGMTQRLIVSGNSQEAVTSAHFRAGRSEGKGGLLGWTALHEVEVGDVNGFSSPLIGNTGSSGRGVRFQAAPLHRALDFDRTRIQGDAQPGWDAELYSGSLLVDFQRIGEDGRFLFDDVALTYGMNPLHVKLYGPQGQMETREYSSHIGSGTLSPGIWESYGYLLESERDVFPSLNFHSREEGLLTGSLRLDYGISQALTVSGRFSRVSRNLQQEDRKIWDYTHLELRPNFRRLQIETGWVRQLDQSHDASMGKGLNAFYGRFMVPMGVLSLSGRHEWFGDGFIASEAGAQGVKTRTQINTTLPLWSKAGSLQLGYRETERRSGLNPPLAK